ncbi:polysaccharide deacetylase family protein [Saprospira sp. CCB-QB6]|uniref:polysaccharide deacetylase family protein n=1 Tax=Saprospira sp. CCB-QB6 TaxID=3023936 RepID=UPI002349A51F|nr:polysaccharide deacetylase family protein [Saprospira sp. CCB-QB6]WCL81492.1 polysaccharide deacetylase family protein [Saprospira sp. CCB-QB6]
MRVVAFYSPFFSARLEYICSLIFEEHLGLSLLYLSSKVDFLAYEGPKLAYGELKESSLFIPQATAILSQKDIRPLPAMDWQMDQNAWPFTLVGRSGLLDFDLLSLAFLAVSRYEEYLLFQEDQHGRFSADQSFFSTYLRRPWLDYHFNRLGELLVQQFPQLEIKQLTYEFLPTYDIDFAYKYKGLPVWRQLGKLVKNAYQFPREFKRQLMVLLGQTQDPYDVFDFLEQAHQSLDLEAAHYFFLLGDYGPYDKNTPWQAAILGQLIQQLTQKGNQIGIHPAYAGDWEQQLERLAFWTKTRPKQSRQHFLRLRFPQTYQQLIALGIESDYSMGYAANIGFRAAYSRSFYWFDLEQNQATQLRIHPFALMDVSLKNYLSCSLEVAKKLTDELLAELRDVSGRCISLWHNSSFDAAEGWGGWPEFYLDFLKRAKKNELI